MDRKDTYNLQVCGTSA